jgi:hypothetical protein
MATKRIKDISTTATTFAADDFIALDASSVGTRKMAKASLITQVGANYLEKADNLSDVASKDTSKLNLEVPNVGTAANEVPVNGMLGDMSFQSSAAVTVGDLTADGHFSGTVGKPMPVNGPSMRFDGGGDHVSFADNDAFSFTNGTDDTPFSISTWVKPKTNAQFIPMARYGGSGNKEFLFYSAGSGGLKLYLCNASDTQRVTVTMDTTLTLNEWHHMTVTYAGAGPNSANSFSNAQNGVTIYLNGKAVAATASNNSYGGMSSTAAATTIGKQGSNYSTGEIRDVKLYNKELSAAEVKNVFSNGQLPESFAESTGAITYVSDFSAGVDSVSATRATVLGNVDSIGGKDDNLSVTISTDNNNHFAFRNVFSGGPNKNYRVSFSYYIPSSNTYVDGIRLDVGATSNALVESAPTFNAWNRVSVEADPDGNNFLYFYMLDGGSSTVHDSSGTDILYIRDIVVTQIGAVLDARAEQFDTSTGKLYDLSGNGFVGTQSGGVSLLGREMPVYETGTWTPVYSPSSGSFAALTMDVTDATYTRIGNLCTVSANIKTDNVDVTGASGSLRIAGLPYLASSSVAAGSVGFVWNWTNHPSGCWVSANSDLMFLAKRSSSTSNTATIDVTDMQSGALANRNNVYITATYQIQ